LQGAVLEAFALGVEEVIDRSKREFFPGEDVPVIGVITPEFPKDGREVAMVGAGEGAVAAGAPLHFGFKVRGGPFADFVGALAVFGFVVAGAVVLVDAVFEGRRFNRRERR
jgi:hypothetical protein